MKFHKSICCMQKEYLLNFQSYRFWGFSKTVSIFFKWFSQCSAHNSNLCRLIIKQVSSHNFWLLRCSERKELWRMQCFQVPFILYLDWFLIVLRLFFIFVSSKRWVQMRIHWEEEVRQSRPAMKWTSLLPGSFHLDSGGFWITDPSLSTSS